MIPTHRSVCACVQTDRHIHRDTHIHRQIDRDTYTDRHTYTDRQTDRQDWFTQNKILT